MQRKKILSIMLSMMLIFILIITGCSGGNNTSPSNTPTSTGGTPTATGEAVQEETGDHDPVTLKLITWNSSYQELYDKFNERYPWITIEPILIDGGYGDVVMQKVAALEAAGTPADLTWVSDLTPLIQNKLVEDLKPFVESDESLKSKKLPEGFFETYDMGDNRYAVPFVDVPLWVVVNLDLLDKAGLEMPGNDWTYDDFREMAAAATDPAEGDYGLTNSNIFPLNLLTAMSVANGNSPNLLFMNEDLTQSVLDKPEVLNDVKWMQEMMTKDGSLAGNLKAKDLGGSVNNFLNGKTLFDIGGDWMLGPLKETNSFEWDVLPFPVGKESQVTYHIYGPISMLSGSKHKEEAYKWISFQFEMEAQKWKIDQGANASVIDDELSSYIDESPMWKGKNTEAVKMTKDMCCVAPGATIPGFSEYGWQQSVAWSVMDGNDVNEAIARTQQWNKRTLELRKELEK